MKAMEKCKAGRKNYRRLQNKLKRATDKAKKEYLDITRDGIMEFQRTEHHDLMYMKMKEVGWKEKQGIQNSGTKDSKGNIRVDKRKIMKIFENHITEIYNQPNQPENLEVELEEKEDVNKKGPYTLQNAVVHAIKELGKRKLQRTMM